MDVWVLVDGENIVRNIVRWDGVTGYDPTPLEVRPYVDGVVIDEPYPLQQQ